MSTFPLIFGLERGELSLVKLFIFQLAFRCVTNKLIERGLIPKFKHGDILAFAIVDYAAIYCSLMEKQSLGPEILRMAVRFG